MVEVTVPSPMYEDPITGGPTDPTVIWNDDEQRMYMFYTQRRPNPHAVGVSWVHGTSIAVASSYDGAHWLYRGTLDLAIEPGLNTFWAPEVVEINGTYHMFVSMIQGVPTDWSGRSRMLHYMSHDLWHWTCKGEIDLNSNRVIDPCIASEPDGSYSMWYKDEDLDGVTCRASSDDLIHWTVVGQEIFDCHQEGPNVFDLGGYRWMISDYWHGLAVYRQNNDEKNTHDIHRWTRCPDILNHPSMRNRDQGFGHHADIWVNPRDEHAYIVYFCHPYAHDDGSTRLTGEPTDPTAAQLSVVQMAELSVEHDVIVCDRNAAPTITLY